MVGVKFSNEYGIIVRAQSLVEKSISITSLLEIMKVEGVSGMDSKLISFGPCFGQEALDSIIESFVNLGLSYFDDFFDINFVSPPWCRFEAFAVE